MNDANNNYNLQNLKELSENVQGLQKIVDEMIGYCGEVSGKEISPEVIIKNAEYFNSVATIIKQIYSITNDIGKNTIETFINYFPLKMLPEGIDVSVAEKIRIASLTPRQLKILEKVSEGYLNKQIADELKISEQTVKNHMTSITNKLNVHSRTEAALMYAACKPSSWR